ncbi:DUF4148 domain-containing protein [Cupriavidus lacunae]|uniref:DUF4148 domain-containing protein n=1 Tax=Cupriavidus lacunae TaxID=2666307 RepID=A0A370NQN5_9BURK|nr:DUF4148 domain-containing protein [Cupriavidus lacunae]RDK07833.1 hypothetical protein DN412_23795 [Cupriavidus lacunae]
MKAIVRTVLVSCAFAAPALTFAQSAQAPLTRAEVRADLIRLEQAGYTPGRGNDATYPVEIQAAEAKVQAQDAAALKAASAGMKPQAQGHLQAAAPSAAGQSGMDDLRSSFYSGA